MTVKIYEMIDTATGFQVGYLKGEALARLVTAYCKSYQLEFRPAPGGYYVPP